MPRLISTVIATLAVSACVFATTPQPTQRFSFLKGLDIPTKLESSSSSVFAKCFESIEKAKALTKANLNAKFNADDSSDVPASWDCNDLKNLCHACSGCDRFLHDASTLSATSKNCLCLTSNPTTAVTLSPRDDCVIIPSGIFTLSQKISGGKGDDCFISLGTDSGAVIVGDEGDDTILVLNNGLDDNSQLDYVSGGDDNDCIYIADDVELYVQGGDGNDIIFGDTHKGIRGDSLVDQLKVEGQGGDDLIIWKANAPFYELVNLYGDYYGVGAPSGDDVIRVKGAVNGVFGDGGDDDIEILNGGNVFYAYGDDYLHKDANGGNDVVKAVKGALVYDLYGDDGDDYIFVDTVIDDVFPGDGDDVVVIGHHGSVDYVDDYYDMRDGNDKLYVHGTLHGANLGYGDDYVEVSGSGRVYELYGYFGDDTFVVHGSVEYIGGGYDNDHAYVSKSGFVDFLTGNDGDDELVVSDGGNVLYLYGGDDDDYIAVESDGTARLVRGGAGNDQLVVKGHVVMDVRGGADDDDIFIGSDADVLTVDGGGGDDVLKINAVPRARIVNAAGNGANGDSCHVVNGVIARNCEVLSESTSSSS